MGYVYIAFAILFTVYGQIILKLRILRHGALPVGIGQKLEFIVRLFLDPLVLSGFVSAFVASVFWMAAMTKFQLSYAYPFMSLSFILVLLLSSVLLGESITVYKVIGMVFITLGIVVTSRSV